MEMRNSTKRRHDEKYVQDDTPKRQKPISNFLLAEEEEEEERQQQLLEGGQGKRQLFVKVVEEQEQNEEQQDQEQNEEQREQEQNEEQQEQEWNEEQQHDEDRKANVERQQQLFSRNIISEDSVDFGDSTSTNMGKSIILLFNDLSEKLSQFCNNVFKPEQDDSGAALHMMGSSGTPVSLGMQLRQSNKGFDVCQVNDESLVKDKLRVGDKIIKVSGREMTDMKVEDVQKLFMSKKSIEITIERSLQLGRDCVDGKNGLHSFVLSYTLSVQDDGVEVFDVQFERCGNYNLLFYEMQPRMCLFRDDFTNGTQAFLRCNNAEIEAGNFDQTMSSIEVHKFINIGNCEKQVWILGNANKFITACNDRSHIELTDGQVGPIISCDGRAFIYSKYPGSIDSIALESLEHPKHYLAIVGNEVKLFYFNNLLSDDGNWQCKLGVTSLTTTQM